ncbi:putative ribonuclease H-like domain-containing protein [Tanacetum coccineum]|uniref:Ribonuclease H-like domain-containing protein n=1 Tax=Tanacetum coccineum TaxID=301880 RepID=A0ABQ5H0G9_9ASTR
MLEFYGNKGIKQEYSNARTPQQNGVAERMNRTLIEAARTMLADSLLPTTFWAEAVSTACYIFNREILLSVLGKYGKSDEDSLCVKGVGYRWMFDIDYLTDSMNYIPVSLENQANPHAGTSEKTNNAGTSQTPKSNASEEKDEDVELIVVPLAVMILEEIVDSRTSSTKSKKEKILTDPQQEEKVSSTDTLEDNPKIQAFRRELEQIALKHLGTVPENNSTSTPSVNTGSQTVNTGRLDHDDSPMPELEIFHKSETGIFNEASYDEGGRILKDCLKLYKMTFFNAMQEELLQFKLQQVWVLVDLPHGMKVIGTKWVYRNKRDERGVVVRNKARLVAQGYTQEEDEDVYVLPTPVFADPYHPKKVYKVVKALYGLHQAPRACCNNTHGDQGPLTKDEEAIDVECTLVQSLIGSPHELNCHSRLDIIYGRFREIVDFLSEFNLSSKSGGWDQFGSNIATALVCLSTGRVYNFSKLIFDGMVANLKSKTKFLMYPRFLQMILNIQTEDKHLYLAVSLTKKIFGNMKRGFRGAPRPLLPSMLLVATNPNAGQAHDAVAPSQPSSSTPPVPSTSSPPAVTTPAPIPVTTPPTIHTSTPTPPPIPTPTPPPIPSPTQIPDTEPTPFEHTYEESSPVHHHFSPPQEQAPSQMPMDDLLQAVPKLISRIDSLEMDLKQTKLTMGNAIVKLVKKVKKLEQFVKRRNLVLSDSEEEEPEVQGRKSQDDPLASSVQGLVTPPTTKVHASGEEQVEDISPNTLEAAKTLSKVASLKTRSIDKGRRYKRRKETKGKKVVSSLVFQEEVDAGAEQVNPASVEQVNTASGVNTGSTKVNTGDEQLSTGDEQVSVVGAEKSTSDQDKGQREGKAPMISEETPKKSKEQVLQEEASLAEAIRLDTEQREEVAKQVHLDSLLAQRIAEEEELNEQQKKRKAQVQFEAQHYTNEDWDLIRAKLEANAELSKSMLGSELQGEDFAKKMVDLVNQRKK